MFIEILNSLHAGYYFMLLLSSADVFQNNFTKNMPGHYQSDKWLGSR